MFPDKVLEWVSDKTGKVFAWWYLLVAELVAIAVLVGAMSLLMPVYPRLEWWYPLFMVGFIAALRLGVWMVTKLFGFDD